MCVSCSFLICPSFSISITWQKHILFPQFLCFASLKGCMGILCLVMENDPTYLYLFLLNCFVLVFVIVCLFVFFLWGWNPPSHTSAPSRPKGQNSQFSLKANSQQSFENNEKASDNRPYTLYIKTGYCLICLLLSLYIIKVTTAQKLMH